jgi:hypothetical protein
MIAIDNKYIGIPFEEMNCWQFICYYFKNELNIKLPCYQDKYKNAEDKESITKLYSQELASKIWPEIKMPIYPDIAVFKIDGYLWHAGIVLGNNYMLHTQKFCNSVIEKYTNLRWKNRLYGFYRYQA